MALRLLIPGDTDFAGVAPFFMIPLVGGIIFVTFLQVVSVGNARRLAAAVSEAISASGEVLIVLKTTELARALTSMDQAAGSQYMQRLNRYAALSLDDEGVGFWDWHAGAIEVLTIPWPKVRGVSAATVDLPTERLRCLSVQIDGAATNLPLVLVEDRGIGGLRLSSDVVFEAVCQSFEANSAGGSSFGQ